MLYLPHVTLIAIDTANHALTELAIAETLCRASFADVLLFSNRPLLTPDSRAPFSKPDGSAIATLPCFARNQAEAEAFMWFGVPPHLATSHALYIQWDGWVVHPEFWTDAFLDYDWIGACWPWHATLSVGNGGFSLRSKRLLDVLVAKQPFTPFRIPEDDAVCRKYRPVLEELFHIRWPDIVLARQFSREHEDGRAFGFHGAWNMLRVLDETTVLRRLDLFSPTQLASISMRCLCDLAEKSGCTKVARRARELMATVPTTVPATVPTTVAATVAATVPTVATTVSPCSIEF